MFFGSLCHFACTFNIWKTLKFTQKSLSILLHMHDHVQSQLLKKQVWSLKIKLTILHALIRSSCLTLVASTASQIFATNFMTKWNHFKQSMILSCIISAPRVYAKTRVVTKDQKGGFIGEVDIPIPVTTTGWTALLKFPRNVNSLRVSFRKAASITRCIGKRPQLAIENSIIIFLLYHIVAK